MSWISGSCSGFPTPPPLQLITGAIRVTLERNLIHSLVLYRYVMITHHSLYARIYKKHWIALMLIFCWLFAYGMQLPTLLNVWGESRGERGRELRRRTCCSVASPSWTFCVIISQLIWSTHSSPLTGIFGYDTKLGTCSILKDAYGRSSKTALFVIAFLIPCIIIIICYTRIFWVVHK